MGNSPSKSSNNKATHLVDGYIRIYGVLRVPQSVNDLCLLYFGKVFLWNAYDYDDDLYYGWKPKTTQSLDGYNMKKRVITNGHSLSPGNLKPERTDILFITLSGSADKKWQNVFTNKEVGIDENISLYSDSILYKSITDHTIKLYYHDTDPDNKPILGEFGGECKIYFYRVTENSIKIRKEKIAKRAAIQKEKEEKQYKEWNMSYNGLEWECFNCSTINITRTCSNCYFAEKERREPIQKDIDDYNKFISKFKEIQNVNSNNDKLFCFTEYFQDTSNGAISINQENKEFIINKHQNKISHIVGKLGFNKGRHSLKFKYLNMDKYPKTTFNVIFRITLTNKCESDKARDLFGFRGKVYNNWTFDAKTKEICYSYGEDGIGFEMGKFWNSNKEIHKNNNKNNKYNICEVVVDFDEKWMFCFLNNKLTIHRWKCFGQDLYGYKLINFSFKDEHGLYYWCFECCAGDWSEPIQILHCY